MVYHEHVCGLYYLVSPQVSTWGSRPVRRYLPQVSLSVHAHIVASTSRTVLSQNFVNPSTDKAIPELRYTFPLYDGVSVVGFVCTINRDRVIRGIVEERTQARQTYDAAVARGETAGLFEQLPNASDVFTTTIGNVPAGAEIRVDITYLGELKHDAEADGIRFTIPTSIAPRYGNYPGQLLEAGSVSAKAKAGIDVVVDVEMPDGSNIKNVQSPSHPISVTVGNTSAGAAEGAEMSLRKASATLSLGTTELGDDFVLHVVATNTADPVAVLEKHPTIPNHRALMATLVPKFNLPSSRPEIVFLCDRSGSMCDGKKIPNMVAALHVFLKSLPVGVKFNICSFGSRYELLFKGGSRSYDAASLKEASAYVDKFDANFGGTEMYQPLEDIFKRRFTDMNLEVFLLTDGEIWDQDALFTMINKYVAESKSAIRVFTLGIGSDVSHALIEGVARAGNGFSQSVGDNEKMNSKVVRMLKASLTPHVNDYTLEVKYDTTGDASNNDKEDCDDDFLMVERVMDALVIDVPEPAPENKQPISLFDASANPDEEMPDASVDRSAGGKYAHVPPVAEPKLLQAPFAIPPLFPFTRTSVYLLMSPQTTQQIPKSVVLRGTAPQGPLELEIPVTVLSKEGQTIHQLAARKAVQDLEEGRGWLHHAKDGSGPESKLLSDRFPGRFSDMVEREAVRLGVTYQVGGKWCSFVAVEDRAKNEAERSKDAKGQLADGEQSGRVETSPPPAYHSGPNYGNNGFGVAAATEDELMEQLSFAQTSACTATATPDSLIVESLSECRTVNTGTLPGAPPPPPTAAPASRFSSLRSSHMSFSMPSSIPATKLNPAPAYVLSAKSVAPAAASSPSPPPGGIAPAASQPRRARPNLLNRVGGVLFSRQAAPAPSSFTMSSDSADMEAFSAPHQPIRRMKAAVQEAAEQPLVKEKKMRKSLFESRGPSYEAECTEGSAGRREQLPSDPLEAIVTLQSFEGSWGYREELLKVLGLDTGKLRALENQFGAIFATGTELLATAAVLAYLEVKVAGKKDEWEMLADKARGWVVEELGKRKAGV